MTTALSTDSPSFTVLPELPSSMPSKSGWGIWGAISSTVSSLYQTVVGETAAPLPHLPPPISATITPLASAPLPLPPPMPAEEEFIPVPSFAPISTPTPTAAAVTASTSPLSTSARGVVHVIDRILQVKEERVATIVKNRYNASNAVLVGGDVLTMGYLAFEGAKAIQPVMKSMKAVQIATAAFGIAGGIINVFVAFICLKESIQAFKNGELWRGIRLFFDFVAFLGIGLSMILGSVGLTAGALSILANPWFVPACFMLVTFFMVIELAQGFKDANNLITDLNLQKAKNFIEDRDWNGLRTLWKNTIFDLRPLETMTEQDQIKALNEKMNYLQDKLGVKAAVEICKLLQAVLLRDRTKALAQITLAEEKIAEWKRSLYVRSFQQFLYIASFAVSMYALQAKINSPILEATQNFGMCAANLIPAYMDAFWLFERNTPSVVPAVSEEDLKTIRSRIPTAVPVPA